MNPLCKTAGLALAVWAITTGCGGSITSAEPPTAPSVSTNGPDGRTLYRQYCITCHGSDGKLGLNGAKDLTQSTLSLEERVHITTHGKNLMTPFQELLDPNEIEAVAKYTFALGR